MLTSTEEAKKIEAILREMIAFGYVHPDGWLVFYDAEYREVLRSKVEFPIPVDLAQLKIDIR